MKKFTCQEILDSFNKEFTIYDDIEVFKALIAYSVGIDDITPTIENKLNDTIQFYFENDNISSIINKDVKNYFENILK